METLMMIMMMMIEEGLVLKKFKKITQHYQLITLPIAPTQEMLQLYQRKCIVL
jgi:hypothetical protein